MHSSAVLVLAVLATISPSLAAPVPFTSAPVAPPEVSPVTASSNATQAGDLSSEAISLGSVATIASIAAPLIGGIIDHFTGQ
jgi:hypothetical protein